MLIVLRLPNIIFLFEFLRSMVFTTASVPLQGDRNLRRKDVTALLGAICSKTFPSFLTVKEGSTSHLGLLPSGKKRKTALLGARTATLYSWRGIKALRHVVRDGTAMGGKAICKYLNFLIWIEVLKETGSSLL